MKKALIFINLLLFPLFDCFAQTRVVEDIIAQKHISQPIYRLKSSLMSALVFNMSYGEDAIISEKDRKILVEAQIISVDLVYTDFPKGQDLTSLNTHRIQKMYDFRKELVTNSDIKWRIIKQTSCTNEAEARVLFHGIVVHYKPIQDKEIIELDLRGLSAIPKNGDSLKSLVSKENPYGIKLLDSTIIKALERNSSWKNMVIVADMTGSMSPYATQLLVWFQLIMKDKRIKQVVFFNDGDSKNTAAKRIGSTGGIYMADTVSYSNILATATKTISKGSGGDCPENNCEALIESINKNPGVKEIIMIADNFAAIKDIILVDKITVPIRIILCGTGYLPIHVDYLTLARKTGGSIHTIAEDIDKLSALNEGQIIKIGLTKYQVIGGAFIRISDL